jgi:hypothetical protein
MSGIRELVTLLDGRVVGRVEQTMQGKLRFSYDQAWRDWPGAPLYDIASVLPYPRRIPLQKANLALRIGSEYRIRKIRRRHWEQLAKEMGLGTGGVESVRDVVQAARGRMEEICAAARAEGIGHPVVDMLEVGVRKHASACLAALDRPARD